MKHCLVAFVVAGMALTAPLAAQKAADEEVKRVAEVSTVLEEIMAAADKAIPQSILDKAAGIAVFPSMIKGGLVVGAQHGRGVLSVRDTKTGGWSSPAFLTINGGSIGAQIGAQAIDLVLIITNERGLQQLVKNQFKL